MPILKKFIVGFCLLLLFFIGILFVARNDESASVDFLLFQTPELSVGLWLLLSLAFGALLGVLLSSFSLLRLRVRNRRLAKEKEASSQELRSLLQEKP